MADQTRDTDNTRESTMADNHIHGRRLSKWDPRLWWDLIEQGNSPWTVLKAGLRGFPGLPR